MARGPDGASSFAISSGYRRCAFVTSPEPMNEQLGLAASRKAERVQSSSVLVSRRDVVGLPPEGRSTPPRCPARRRARRRAGRCHRVWRGLPRAARPSGRGAASRCSACRGCRAGVAAAHRHHHVGQLACQELARAVGEVGPELAHDRHDLGCTRSDGVVPADRARCRLAAACSNSESLARAGFRRFGRGTGVAHRCRLKFGARRSDGRRRPASAPRRARCVRVLTFG